MDTNLIDGTMVRKEPFGYFLAFPDGDMDFFPESVVPLLKLGQSMVIPRVLFDQYRMENIVNNSNSNWNYVFDHPLIVSLELTTKCNAVCQICYINGGDPRPNEMTDSEHRKLWQELIDAKVCCILLTGGEPLLHPLLSEAIDFFHSNGVTISLGTNGVFLTEEFIKKLPKYDFGMGVSIDSYSFNQDIRGSGLSFDDLKPKIKMLRDAQIDFNVIATLSKLNIGNVLPLIEWCEKNNIMLETLEAQPFGRALINQSLLLGEEDAAMDSEVYQAKEELEDKYEERHYRSKRYFSGFLEICYRVSLMTRRCEGARTIAYITSDGDVYPCSNCASSSLFSAGNVTTKTFAEIWETGFSDMRRIIWDDFKLCRECELSVEPYFCPTRCPALSYVKGGQYNEPGCTPYMKKIIKQRTHIHEDMHNAQKQKQK